jgi:hypothetical protein
MYLTSMITNKNKLIGKLPLTPHIAYGYFEVFKNLNTLVTSYSTQTAELIYRHKLYARR